MREFDKYAYYLAAVQSPEPDAVFMRKVYRELKGRDPRSFCEDFCGTFAISCEWVKMGSQMTALGIDLDPEPIGYGQGHYLPKLSAAQQKRLNIIQGDVLKAKVPKVDVIAALNFSYYLFKKRKDLLRYFLSCKRRLKQGGVLILDSFGGSACQISNEEETVHRTFSYFWDQVSYDPITNEALFHIHFKPKGQSKKLRQFTYDWRMWTIPELREVLDEAGFKKTHVYWEGTTKSGEGDGKFTRREKGEECEAWVAYVVAEV